MTRVIVYINSVQSERFIVFRDFSIDWTHRSHLLFNYLTFKLV